MVSSCSITSRDGAGESVERDDDFIAANRGPLNYFEPYRRWPSHQRLALRLARGRVLDVGCGAGRVALHLQERGLDVVAVDISPRRATRTRPTTRSTLPTTRGTARGTG